MMMNIFNQQNEEVASPPLFTREGGTLPASPPFTREERMQRFLDWKWGEVVLVRKKKKPVAKKKKVANWILTEEE